VFNNIIAAFLANVFNELKIGQYFSKVWEKITEN